jgi:hypothetical protein
MSYVEFRFSADRLRKPVELTSRRRPLLWATRNFYQIEREMSTDELSPDFENGKRHFAMNAKFCARMRAAIAQGLESTPIGVITTPGTKHPKCVTNQITSYDLSRDEQ